MKIQSVLKLTNYDCTHIAFISATTVTMTKEPILNLIISESQN